ncbi:MAG: dTMP kinase [Dehalococcoidia bacterium]|nr:dTMP kinase [Dehalococcoidia bacterium]
MAAPPPRHPPEAEAGGVFITLEGGDGSGKSTQARALAKRLRRGGYAVVLTGEPAGTGLGRTVKSLLEWLGSPAAAAAINPRTEMLIFEARRAQHVEEVIRPALERGDVVLCDRFTDSTLAYQGYGRGLDPADIESCNRIATGGLRPDLTLLLDIAPEEGLARAGTADDAIGREPLAFHERVRRGFLELARREPERCVVLDAALPPDVVTRAAWDRVQALLPPV